MNDKYQNLKNFKKIHSYLTEAAMRWNTLNGCYPSMSGFSSFINEHMGENLLSFNSTEELNENHVRTITNKLVYLFEDGADKFANMSDAQFQDLVKSNIGAKEKAEALRKKGLERKKAGKAGKAKTPKNNRSTQAPKDPKNNQSTQAPKDPGERTKWARESEEELRRAQAERARQQWNHNRGTETGQASATSQPPRQNTAATRTQPRGSSIGSGLKTAGKIGLGVPLAIGADIALDKPAETVAKAFGAEEPETIQKTKEAIKSPVTGFASMIPFGLKMAGKGALGGIYASAADIALDKPAKAAARALGAEEKDVDSDAGMIKDPFVYAAGGAAFGVPGAVVGAGIGSAVAAGKLGYKAAETIWGDDEIQNAQDEALDAEIKRARILRDPDEQKKLGITPEQAEERIKSGAPAQGGEFLGLATAGNITGETAEERKRREETEKELAKTSVSASQIKQGVAATSKPFEDMASQQRAQSVLDSPFFQDAMARSKQKLNEFVNIARFAPAVARTVAPAIERTIAPTAARVLVPAAQKSAAAPTGRLAGRIDSMIDDVVNLTHDAPETAAKSFPANRTVPDFAPPLTTPKPYRPTTSPLEPLPFAEPTPRITPEIEIPTIHPIVPTPKPSPMKPLPFAEPAPRTTPLEIEPVRPTNLPARRTTPLEIEPVRPTKPLVPARKPQTGMVPAIDTELETLTSSPLAAPITSPITKTSPLTAPITNTGVSTKTALSTATGRQTKARTPTRTQTRTQTKTQTKTPTRIPTRTRTKTGIPFPTGGFGDQFSDTDNVGFVDSPIPVNLAAGERRGALKRSPIQMFDGSWTTSPTTVNEGKLSEKESLKRKLTKQKYKIVYVQEGKKVEVFASSIRGVRRAVYGKKQFRVYNSSGSDLTGYFKKLIKK